MSLAEPSAIVSAGQRQAFLDAMAQVAFSVSVVTTDGPAGRDGVTVTAMTSVSMDAQGPTLLISLYNRGRAANTILKNGVFCVNVLAQSHTELAERFAGRGGATREALFRRLELHRLVTGSPVLKDAIASLDCRVQSLSPVGEHLVVFGSVQATASGSGATPLLHWQRSYRSLHDAHVVE